MSHALACEFIYSDLAVDPDLAELVDVFVNEVPDRVARMQKLAAGHDWEGLRRLAHQLRGAAGSYGFGDVTPFAARLESNLKDAQPEDIVLSNLCELIEICGRLRGGMPA